MPETGRESAVMVDNSTEVTVIPKENPLKDRFPSRPSSKPSTATSFLAEKLGGSENLSENNLIKEFIYSQEKNSKLRILSKHFMEDSIQEKIEKFKRNNVVISLNQTRSNHIRKSIVSIKSELTGDTVFGFFFEYPENPFDGEQRKISNLLKV